MVKKFKYIFFFFFLFSSGTYSQSVTFKEIKLNADPKFYSVKEKTIIYPIIVSKNKSVDKIINEKIKNEILQPDEEKKSIVNDLKDLINNGLTDLYYDVTFNKNGILSLNIYTQVAAAYLSSSIAYFNFDIMTGKNIEISDLLEENKIDSFKKMVFENKRTFLKNYKTQVEKDKNLNKNEIDSTTYDWIVSEVDSNCINEIQIESFSLSSLNLEIIDPCEFPHIIRALEPDYNLKYSYKFIYQFIKPEFKKRLKK